MLFFWNIDFLYRDKLKIQDYRGPPKSPRSKSPQSPHPSSPLAGGPLNRRSLGHPDSKLVVLGVPCVGKSGKKKALLIHIEWIKLSNLWLD